MLETILIYTIGTVFIVITIYFVLKIIAFYIADFNLGKYGSWRGEMPEWLVNIIDRLTDD